MVFPFSSAYFPLFSSFERYHSLASGSLVATWTVTFEPAVLNTAFPPVQTRVRPAGICVRENIDLI